MLNSGIIIGSLGNFYLFRELGFKNRGADKKNTKANARINKSDNEYLM